MTAARDLRDRCGLARVLGAAALVLLQACSAENPPENLLLITIDACRADHMSPYGYERDTTPHIGALAARSTLFERAYSHAASTAPALSSLMTSRYVHQHGVLETYKYALAEEETTMAERLAAAGLQTAAFTGIGVLMPSRNLDQGFATYSFARYTNQQYWKTASEVAEEALAWLRDNHDEPFFLWAHFFEPHQPYDIVPRPWLERFSDSPSHHPLLSRDDPQSPRYARVRQRIDHYDGALAYTDSQVGRLLRELEVLGLDESTLVVVSADHGEGLGEHGLHGHLYEIYEPLIRVPLIIHVPGEGPSRVRETVEQIDILPTVLAVLGLPHDATLEGRVLPVGSRGRRARASSYAKLEPRSAFSETWARGQRKSSLTSGRWKLILTQAPDAEELVELYDLAEDPHETHNLAGADPGRRDELRLELDARRKAVITEPRLLRQDAKEIEMLRALGYVE